MKKPKIRFNGYTEDWEQRKLEDVMDTVTDYVAAGSFEDIRNNVTYLNEPGYAQLVRTVDLKKKFTNNDSVYVDESAFKYLWRVNLNDECIVLPNIGANIGEVYFLEPSGLPYDNNVLGPNAILLKANEDTYFAFTTLNNLTFQKQLFENVGSSGQPKFNKTELKSIQLYMPQNEEQIKIGQYFRNLDHLITLHQCKYTFFREVNVSTWEQRKLGDVAEFSKGSGYSKGDLIEFGMPIILYGRLYTKYETSISDVDTFVEAKDGSVYSKGGEVIVPASGETAEDIARAATVDKSGILLGGDLNVVMPNEDINSAFLAISISNGNSQRELAKKAQGKSVVHIHNEEIRNLVVPFPTKMEQSKIVTYFSTLDHLITLHHHKLHPAHIAFIYT
ncbi:restriction endonuclease subunit S [Falcatimonas sp. MSJ-15]|uniref:restriction endonuclease subunit S n=1 Tax=Falcatimonas sp. MSJ-15 TaxID=2841515 RepID=UPI00209D764D|nr:restriction endonuclease subunit S [Falcatimonas sp. MSJ-15]